MTTRPLLICFLALMCSGLGGCWSTPAPTISVIGLEAGDSTPDGSLLVLELEAQSTAEDQLPLKEVRYRVTLDGREVFSGFRSPQSTLRRFGTQRLLLPAVLPASISANGTYRIDGSLMYAEPGTIAGVLFDFGVRTPTVDFSGTGTVGMPQASR